MNRFLDILNLNCVSSQGARFHTSKRLHNAGSDQFRSESIWLVGNVFLTNFECTRSQIKSCKSLPMHPFLPIEARLALFANRNAREALIPQDLIKSRGQADWKVKQGKIPVCC